MKVLKKIGLLILMVLFLTSVLTYAQNPADLRAEKKQDNSSTISELINDSIRLKLILLDLEEKSLFAGWKDREVNNITPLGKLLELLASIVNKYEIDIEKLRYTSYIKESFCQNTWYRIMIKEPQTWSEIIALTNSGKLPIVKHRSSSHISLDLRSYLITFDDGAKALVNGKEYEYHKGEWLK